MELSDLLKYANQCSLPIKYKVREISSGTLLKPLSFDMIHTAYCMSGSNVTHTSFPHAHTKLTPLFCKEVDGEEHVFEDHPFPFDNSDETNSSCPWLWQKSLSTALAAEFLGNETLGQLSSFT